MAHRVQFWQPRRKIRVRITKNFRSNSKKVNQLKVLFKTFFFFNMILWTFKNKFERARRKEVTKKSKTFRSMIENAFSIKTPLKSNFYPKIAPPARWLQFLPPCRKVFNGNKRNRSESDVDIKSAIISKTLFSSESGNVNFRAVLSTVSELFREESKTILVKVLKR